MSNRIYTAIGLMSGTSADGVDAAIIRTDGENFIEIGQSHTINYPPEFQKAIKGLYYDLSNLFEIEKQITLYHAEAVNALLDKTELEYTDIDYIGFHGQTIIHLPAQGITKQIGNPALLAQATKINVVADFRSTDVASGGQGAPLVPIYHYALFNKLNKPVAVVNIGGVSNITYINNNEILAFDCGPGGCYTDDLAHELYGQTRDYDGKIAALGEVHHNIVEKLFEDPIFQKKPPKSLERNHFQYKDLIKDLCPADSLATMTYFTSEAIIRSKQYFSEAPSLWILTGGGRYNKTLRCMLSKHIPIADIGNFGLDGDTLEAQAFGYLAIRRVRELPISFPNTTSTGKPISGGAIWKYC